MSFTVTDEPVFIDLTLSENKEEVSDFFFWEFVFGLHKYSLNQDFDDVMVQQRERMK